MKTRYNKAVKPFACGSLGRSALRACSGMASPLLPEQSLHAERRLPWRYKVKRNRKEMMKYSATIMFVLLSFSVNSETYNRSAAIEEYNRQLEIYKEQTLRAQEQSLETDRQLKESAEQQLETKRQLEEVAKQQEITEQLLQRAVIRAEREDRLLERRERQADKYDLILEKMETQLGITK